MISTVDEFDFEYSQLFTDLTSCFPLERKTLHFCILPAFFRIYFMLSTTVEEVAAWLRRPIQCREAGKCAVGLLQPRIALSIIEVAMFMDMLMSVSKSIILKDRKIDFNCFSTRTDTILFLRLCLKIPSP
jgi:hypothetical protein